MPKNTQVSLNLNLAMYLIANDVYNNGELDYGSLLTDSEIEIIKAWQSYNYINIKTPRHTKFDSSWNKETRVLCNFDFVKLVEDIKIATVASMEHIQHPEKTPFVYRQEGLYIERILSTVRQENFEGSLFTIINVFPAFYVPEKPNRRFVWKQHSSTLTYVDIHEDKSFIRGVEKNPKYERIGRIIADHWIMYGLIWMEERYNRILAEF